MSERVGIMLAKKATPAYISRCPSWNVQPKLNGDRCRALITNGKCQLVSSQGHDRNFAVPHVVSWLEHLLQGVTVELDGELYCHRMPHQDIRSIVSRTVERHPHYQKISYHVFDLIEETVRQDERLDVLTGFLAIKGIDSVGPIHLVETHNHIPADRIDSFLSYMINEGYEGIILRNPNAYYYRGRTSNLLKIKPTLTMTCFICGAMEEVSINGEPKGSLGALRLYTQDGTYFSCGTGPVMTRAFRQQYWPATQLLDRSVLIKYQELSNTGVPIHPVLMAII